MRSKFRYLYQKGVIALKNKIGRNRGRRTMIFKIIVRRAFGGDQLGAGNITLS